MLTSKFIGVGIIAAGVVAGSAIIIISNGHKSDIAPSSETAHTADWYVAHPDILKTDDAKCGGDAASIPLAACQNAATADQRLLSLQLQQAGATNTAAAKAQTPKTP